jgi:hypothetical protein
MIDRAEAAASAGRTVQTRSAAGGPGAAKKAGPAVRTLADRLSAARRGAFVGRRGERALFAAALAGDGDPFSVLYIYGPGGIGKSALLHQLADDARQAGRHPVQIDGRLTDSSPPAFAATAAGARRPGSVLLVDTFERCQALEIWLCQRFLPSLPADSIVVIASRLPPDPGWRADPAWSAALRIITLRNLEPGDSAALLSSRGVSRGQRAALLAFAGGHPLALSLAAGVATRTPPGQPRARLAGQPWEPGQDVVGQLLSQLVGELPSGQHRQAVELCAHVEYTTEDLLRSVFGDDAPGLFSWLRGLPFVEAGPQGLYPHDIVRTALETDLRWRDPDSYERMHAAARAYLVGQVSQAAEAEAIERTGTLLYIYRRSPLIIGAFCFRDPDGEYPEEYRPQDRAELLALTARSEGAPAPGLVGFWLDRQPEAFRVYRRSSTGELVAYDAMLRFTGPDEDSSRADPVLAAVWEYCDRNGPMRPGECLSVARFRVYHQPEPRLSAVTDYMQLRIVAEWVRPRSQAWTFVAEPEDSIWRAQLERVEHPMVVPPVAAGAGATGTPCALFAHDWRRAPLGPFLDRQSAWAMAGADPRDHGEPADYPVLSRPEFDSAIRAALKSLRSDDLERNVLARSRLAGPPDGGNRAEAGSRADALREVLTAAIQALSADPKEAKLHRVLDETFLRGTPTQEAAAAMLHLPFSTYRRYLARGTEIISDRLWDAELGAVANGNTAPGGE